MTLYLLRHAEAEAVATTDSARRLTAKGCVQARKVGEFCADHGIEPGLILTSPVTRARQTADIVARELSVQGVMEVPWAACGMNPAEGIAELGACGGFPTVLLVGHQPDLGLLAASLLGMESAGALRFRKALLVSIAFEGRISPGAGMLDFFLPVKLM
jgi:phosphohistidine phosphatase